MRTRTRYPRVLAAVLALAVVVRLPALAAPPVIDDHVQAAMSAGDFPSRRAWWDLYAFARGDAADRARLRAAGNVPWWAADDYQLVMFRPLSSALLALDHALLPHWSLARAHSLGWMLAWVIAAAALLRRRVGEGVALGAAALLAMDDSLTAPLAWHANRCAFVALFFAARAVDRGARWLDEGDRRDAAASVGHAALACLAGEYAWTLLPAAALYGGATRSPRRRSVYLGLAALAALYAVARAVAGAGARSAVIYPDLTRDLGLLLFLVPVWVVTMLGDLLAGAGVEHHGAWLGLTTSRGVIALVGAALIAVAWRRADLDDRRRAMLRWALGAGLASIAVVSTAWLSSRLMGAAGLWSAALVSMLAAWAWRDRVGRAAALALLVAHGPWKAAQTWIVAARYRSGASRVWEGGETLLPAGFGGATGGRDETVYVLNAINPEEVYFGRYTRLARGLPAPARWFVLTSTPTSVWAYREDARTLALVHPRAVLDGMAARFFRSGVTWPPVGSVFALGDARLTLFAAGAAGPTRLRVVFDRDLGDPSLNLLVSTREGLRRFTPPAVGASVEVPAPREGGTGPR